MARVFIGIGSNIDPQKNVRRALKHLSRQTRLLAVSTFYRTPALHRPADPHFVNGVALVETSLDPLRLKQCLRDIEARLGRVRTADKYAPRIIDLDILLYEQQIVDTAELKIPDPAIFCRAFVAVPLAELAPKQVVPGDCRSLDQIAAQFAAQPMEALPGFAV